MNRQTMGNFSAYLGVSLSALSFSIVFPFSNILVEKLGGSDKESQFVWILVLNFSMTIAQLVSSLGWGYISSIWGARKVAIFSILMSTLLNLAFGFSTGYWWALGTRFLLGLVCCLNITSYTIINEANYCNPRSNAWIVLYWQIGYLLGNIVGGLSSDNEDFVFPFLLPCSLVSAFGLLTLALSYFFLPESTNREEETKSYLEMLKKKQVFWSCAGFFTWMCVDVGFQEIVIIWFWTGRYEGGLGMNPYEILAILVVSTVLLLSVEVPLYRLLLKCSNVVKMTKCVAFLAIFFLLLFPLMAFYKDELIIRIILMILLLSLWWSFGYLNGSNLITTLNNSVVDEDRDKINAITATLDSTAKIVSPLIFGSLFSVTMKTKWTYPVSAALSYHLMAGLALITFFIYSKECIQDLYKPRVIDEKGKPLINRS